VSWSLFKQRSKFEIRNPSGYKLFNLLFSDICRAGFGKTIDEFLESVWESCESDFSSVQQAIKRGIEPKDAGFAVSMQLNNAAYDLTRKFDDQKDAEECFFSGTSLALVFLARMAFGTAPAISKSTGKSNNFVLTIMIDTGIGLLISGDSHLLIDDDNNDENAALVDAFNSGYKEIMLLAKGYCEI
jgi:hypothetical protein